VTADALRVGVIGANPDRSWASAVHLPALAALNGVELTAVATTRMASAEDAARRWGASHAFADAYELIAHPDVDVVTVALQMPRRGDLVESALAAGKNVYCEWPFALDAERAARLRDLAALAGVRTMVGLQLRKSAALRYFRDLVARGEVGEVLSVSLTYETPFSPLLPQRMAWIADTWRGVWPGQNHLAVVGGHVLDMFRYSTGELSEVSALLITRTPNLTIIETGERLAVTSPDHILLHGRLESGAAASAVIRFGGRTGDGLRIEVRGREGMLLLRSDSSSLVGAELNVAVARDADLRPLMVPASYQAMLPGADPAIRNVGEAYAELARAIRAGKPAEPDFATATSLHRLLDAIAVSAATGRRQSLG